MTSKMNAITYAFRRPRFPMICDLNGYLVAAESPTALHAVLLVWTLLRREKSGWLMQLERAGCSSRRE